MLSPETTQVVARCTRAQAEVLVHYDHHHVLVAGRWGILITYPWMPLEEAPEPLLARVIFNPSPRHIPSADQARAMVFKHPPAPEAVQRVIDALHFEDDSSLQ